MNKITNLYSIKKIRTDFDERNEFSKMPEYLNLHTQYLDSMNKEVTQFLKNNNIEKISLKGIFKINNSRICSSINGLKIDYRTPELFLKNPNVVNYECKKIIASIKNDKEANELLEISIILVNFVPQLSAISYLTRLSPVKLQEVFNLINWLTDEELRSVSILEIQIK